MTVALQSAIPVLGVADYPRARAFWRDRLGFEVIEEGGDPPCFGIFVRGRAQIFLDGWQGPPAKTDRWAAYLHVSDVEGLANEFRTAGVRLLSGPETAPYGLREVEIRDSEGNALCFGEILSD